MKGAQVPVVLIQRYTSFIEAATYTSAPAEVEAFSKATLTVWRGLMPGTGTRTCTFYLEDSHDANAWRVLNGSGVDPGPDATVLIEEDLERRWLRMRVVVSGPTGTGVSCYAAGTLELRVDGGAG